jgi:hypothetical protein
MTMRRVPGLAPVALVLSLASSAFAQVAPESGFSSDAEAPGEPPADAEALPSSEPAPVSEAPAPLSEPPPPAAPLYPSPPPARVEVRPAPPPIETETEAPELDDGEFGSHQSHYTLQFGVRTSFIAEPGFDLFSENDSFVQAGFAGGRVLVADGPWSVAALVGWDFGSRRGAARGAATELYQHRFWLGGEARYHVLRRLYAFARLAPTLLVTDFYLRDPIVQGDREAGGITFGGDASLGAAFEIFGKASGASSKLRGWVTADGGYGWAGSKDLSFSVSEDDSAPTRTATLDLGELAFRGGFFRVGAAVTF